MDNIICNRSENVGQLAPYLNQPVYVKGYCYNKRFDGWCIIHNNDKVLIDSRKLVFDYRGDTYSAYGFLPSRFTMITDSRYNNAFYKEEANK
jgi:hypothetical protein